VWLTDLADVARSAGLDVREAPGWKTRGHGPMTDVRTITCHHTASSGTNDMSLSLLVAGRSDLPGPIANLGLGRSGRVYIVAAGLAYHAGQSCDPSYTNSHAIGIEGQASGVDPWPDVQMDAYARLCRALADHYGLPYSRVLGHKETCAPRGRKVDPNFDMGAFRARIANLEDDMPTPRDLWGYDQAGARRQAWSYLQTADANARSAAKDSAAALEIVKALAAHPTGLSAAEIAAAAERGAKAAIDAEIDSATVTLTATKEQP
jgi:hypothetical protein